MSEEEEKPPPHPLLAFFGRPPTPAEVLEQRKAASNFAKATLPALKALQRAARDLNTLYMDAPIQSQNLAHRIGVIREHTAVLLEEMEGLAEQ